MTLLEKIKGMFKFLDIHGLKYFFEGLRKRGVKYIFNGTEEEWKALTTAQQDHYEIAHIKGDNSVAGTVVDVVKKDDMRAVTSNAVFQERARGVVPDGVSIDDMVGPEWVGTWKTTEATLGHFPYAAGVNNPVNATLNIYATGMDITEQEMIYYNNIISRRRYSSNTGWLDRSDTPVIGTYFGGWRVEYHDCFDVLINFEGTYGIESYIRMDVAGHPSLWIQRRAGYTTVVPMHTPVSLYTQSQVVSALWMAGISTRRVSWALWGSSFDWVGSSAVIQYNSAINYIEIIYNEDVGPDSTRKHFLPLDW